MPEVAPIGPRKADHIRINLEEDVRSGLSNGLETYRLPHEALPECNLDEISTDLVLFGKRLRLPLQISSMTGGTAAAERINRHLAEAAAAAGIALGVGSQRAAIEDPKAAQSFRVVRQVAPQALIFANLGAVQLNYGYGLDECRRAIDMVAADALILHLNPLQEALQPEGDVNFSGLAKKIEAICRGLETPVIVKEVGWGISERTARLLANCGVAAIDVAGAGGTSWSQVEMYRTSNAFQRQLAASFRHWGIPTAESLVNVRRAAPEVLLFASGGLQDGLDVVKSLALGAHIGGLAGPFLQVATQSAEAVLQRIQLLAAQIRVAMFAAGAPNLQAVRKLSLHKEQA